MTRPTAAAQLAAIQAVQARRAHITHSGAEPSDGPGERVIAAADLDAKADREADRDERFREAS